MAPVLCVLHRRLQAKRNYGYTQNRITISFPGTKDHECMTKHAIPSGCKNVPMRPPWEQIVSVLVVGKEDSKAKKSRQMIIRPDKVNVRVALGKWLFWRPTQG